jgi:hypothetical protein
VVRDHARRLRAATCGGDTSLLRELQARAGEVLMPKRPSEPEYVATCSACKRVIGVRVNGEAPKGHIPAWKLVRHGIRDSTVEPHGKRVPICIGTGWEVRRDEVIRNEEHHGPKRERQQRPIAITQAAIL